MTRPFVTHPSGARQSIKNLGWLLRHAQEVSSITLRRWDAELFPTGHDGGAILTACLRDGRAFTAFFQDSTVAAAWVGRRALHHAIHHDTREATGTARPVYERLSA